MPALQLAQVGQQWSNFAAGVLVDTVQPHEGIEDQQPRLQSGDRLGEVLPVGIEVEAHGRRGDHLDIEIGERDARSSCNTFETAADDVKGVLGGEEENATGAGYREAAQARRSRGNGHGQIEGQE